MNYPDRTVYLIVFLCRIFKFFKEAVVRLTTMVMALLLYAFSFGVEARNGAVREAWRTSVTALQGVAGKGIKAVGTFAVVATICLNFNSCTAIDHPNYLEAITADEGAIAGLSVEEAARFSDSKTDFYPEDFNGLLVAYWQGNAMSIGIAEVVEGLGRHELVVKFLEGGQAAHHHQAVASEGSVALR